MSTKKLGCRIVTFSKEEYNNYQKYCSSKKEWPGVNIADRGIRVDLNLPMLLMELYRLVPYKDGRYVNFHPFNMSHIKVRKIELVGNVTSIIRGANTLILTIEDGTGVAKIHYKIQQYTASLKQRKEIDEKYRIQAKNLKKDETMVVKDYPKKFPETRPGFYYSPDVCLQDIADLENKWSVETNNGLLGKEIELFDYVYISGYPCLDTNFQEIPDEITKEFIENAKLIVFALSVTCISEETYNKKLSMWMSSSIQQRYKDNKY